MSDGQRDKTFEFEINKTRMIMRFRALLIAFFALCLGLITACSDGPDSTANPQDLPTTKF